MQRIFKLMLVLASLTIGATSAHALSSYVTTFNTTYPAAAATLGQCKLCHINPAGGGTRTSYGNAFLAAGHSFTAIAALDSDGDGYTNAVEIAALTWPGDATSHPVAAADTTAPTVSGFTVPATSSTLSVPITLFTATDNVAVTGYMVNESATAPASGAAGWSATAPTSYTVAAAGAHTLFAWAKDAAGNVSASKSGAVTVTVSTGPNKTILWRNSTTGAIAAWSMSGVTKMGYTDVGMAPMNWQIAGMGDFNGDGQSDILWTDPSTGALAVWYMNGTTHTGYADLGSSQTKWQVAGVGDFNGDGKPDILFRDTTTGNIGVWYMNGVTHTGAVLGSAPLNWQIAGVGDFNGDGKPDILWRDSTTGAIALWYMNGATYTGYADVGSAPLNWQITGISDMNGDGQNDILWRDTTTGASAVWYMSGITHTGYADIGIAPMTWQVAGVQ